jgi:hypothetical protein
MVKPEGLAPVLEEFFAGEKILLEKRARCLTIKV